MIYKDLALKQKDETVVWDALYNYSSALRLRGKNDSSMNLVDSLLTLVNNLNKNYKIYHNILVQKTANLVSLKKYKEAMQIAGQLMISAQKYKDTDALIFSYFYQATIIGRVVIN
jgi:hypothetical protein